jgi:Resolvase, N terminal domain
LHLSSRAGSQNATEQTLAFIDVHAKQTSRHRATIAREISEAAKIGDDVLTKIVRSHFRCMPRRYPDPDRGGFWRYCHYYIDQLAGALKICRALGATLIIAKLDRLARNVHFVSGLMKSGVEFTAVDFQQANRLTVHILAALAAAKRRGVKLGGDRGARLTARARQARCEAVTERANARAARGPPSCASYRRPALRR